MEKPLDKTELEYLYCLMERAIESNQIEVELERGDQIVGMTPEFCALSDNGEDHPHLAEFGLDISLQLDQKDIDLINQL